MQIGFYFDQTRCTGCGACQVACKDWQIAFVCFSLPRRWREKHRMPWILRETERIITGADVEEIPRSFGLAEFSVSGAKQSSFQNPP